MEPIMELLAPAGSPEILKAVINAGADAVYLGGDQFGARAYAANFSKEDLLDALDYAHLRDKKIYLTVNTLLKNDEINALYDYLLPFYLRGLDAVLVQDMGALVKIHEWFPKLPIHTSTQMTVTGVEGVRFLQQYGVTRVVMAREVSLPEMKIIHDETGMELEAFVHGALCYCYSGQCLFSSMLGGRSGNRGRCAQPCRLPYTVIGADGRTIKEESYILSLKDFCTIDSLRKMRDSGVYSLKIEGRMKQKSYAAGVVAMYRKYLDKILTPEKNGKNFNYQVSKEDHAILAAYGSRIGFTDGYLIKHNGSDMITYQKPSFSQTSEYTADTAVCRRIDGHLKLWSDRPMELRVSDGAHQVTVTGNIPDPAKNQPVTREDVEKRIRKTGDTAFAFDRLTVDLDDGLFVPNGVLNQLKRDALEQLQSEILKGYTRTSCKPDSGRGAGSADAAEGVGEIAERHIVSTANRSLLPVILSYDKVTDVYLDSTAYDRKNLAGQLLEDVLSCHQAEKLVYFILPSICREETMKFYRKLFKEPAMASLDGFVVKNLESLALVNEHFPDKKLICDHNLYAYNDDAVAAFLRAGADGVTVPLELNRKEIAGRYNGAGEMWVYGYYPLMTTAQCVCKNTEGCAHTPGVRYLVDRYRKRFAVQNCCAECYNIIYNSVPTMLFSYLGELKRYGITGYRLHFSVEAAEEAKRILQLYDAFLTGRKTALSESEKSLYTNGHYKRGVE